MRTSFSEHRIRARVWLLLAALAGALTMWLEPRLAARPEPRKRIAWRDDSAYWGGGPIASASAPIAQEPPAEPEPPSAPLPAWPKLPKPDAAAQGAHDAQAAHEAAVLTDAPGDAAPESAVVAELAPDAGAEVEPEALAAAMPPDAAFGVDPNAPLIVPLYTSVPNTLPVVEERNPTLGGTALSPTGAGGTSFGLAGGTTVGTAGGTAVGTAGGTAVGIAGHTAPLGPGVPFGSMPALRPAPLLGPFPTPVAIVLTPLGWVVVPLR